MQHKKQVVFDSIVEYIRSYKENNSGGSPTVREIAEAVGISAPTVSRYMKELMDQNVLKYSGHRNIVTKEYDEHVKDIRVVPVLGRVSCGVPKLAEENIEDYVPLPGTLFGKGDLYALYANGDSMIGAGIEDGDIVIVRAQSVADSNDIVVALKGEEEATLKRFKRVGTKIYLHPENDKYEDISAEDAVIQGKAISVIKMI